MNIRASRWSRLVASILDWAYCWWPLLLAGFLANLFETWVSDPGSADDLAAAVCIATTTASAILLLRNLSQLQRTGQTWGKRKMNLLVIMENGRRAPSKTLFWRSVGPYLMLCVPFVNIAAYFDAWFILGSSKKCLHDMLVGTIVIEADSYEEAASEEGTGLSPTYDDIGFSRFN